MRTASYTRQASHQLGRKQFDQQPTLDAQSPVDIAKAFGFERHIRITACHL
jgi:hypothetical protein